ncbi:cytochrome P450 [Meira miltonrushii]|uniref:Cytochrome P450 n=1 Tax=Meira miltonrushii TaxID=1280837 RepID=A0A316V811_9BASI|nr:cytochrome P450 [Meira miltonrushii]PWN33640.1 cytochrome P450 [Meira miltonrushii]
MPHTYWNNIVSTPGSSAGMGQSNQIVDHASNLLQATIDRFGLILPSAVLALLILGFIYHDRLVFSPGKRSGIYDIPGGLPLIGHTHQIMKFGTTNQFHRFQELALMSPTQCYRLTFAGVGSMIMINRPEYIEYVQKTNFENYPKGFQFRDKLGDLLGHDGIFVADGDVWKTQRKMASHMFSANQFNNWVRVVVHNELNTIDTILDKVASQKRFSIQGLDGTTSGMSDAKGGMVNMTELFFRYTLSSFAKMAFGSDLGCLTEDPASLENPHPFAVAFDFSQGVMNKRFVNPFWRILEAITPEGARMRSSIKLIRNFGTAIIKQRLVEAGIKIDGIDLNEKSEFSQEHKDLLALFMEQTQDPEALLTVVLNFMIAGRDTTAQTLSWLLYELCANPEHVKLIREEVDRVLGPDAAEQRVRVNYTDFKKFPYTLACFHEAARLHPSVPKNGKEILRDDVIVPQGPNPHNLPPIKVYAKERVGWSDWVMNRLPEVWGEDADQFNPKRFLEKDEKGGWSYVQQSQWKFHVFNAGPRLCLGMNLAGFEGVSFLAAMLQKYDFTWASKQQGQTSDWPPMYANSVTHPMKDSYQCIITPRNYNE